MKVFLDTNVVIDFLAKRELFFEDAERIFSLAENPAYELCISALSFFSTVRCLCWDWTGPT